MSLRSLCSIVLVFVGMPVWAGAAHHQRRQCTCPAPARSTMLVPLEPVTLTDEVMRRSGWPELPGPPERPTSEDYRKGLINHAVTVVSSVITTSGEINFIIGKTSGKHENLRVVQDYINYRTLTINNEAVRVGVGIRLTAFLHSISGKVGLEIFNIGISASHSRTAGNFWFEVFGVTGPGISAHIPAPAPLTKDNVMNAMMALAVLKAKIAEEKTQVRPVALAKMVDVRSVTEGRVEPIDGEAAMRLQVPDQ